MAAAEPGATCVYYVAMSLDGYIARQDGSVDWLEAFPPEPLGFSDFYAACAAVVMGRNSYDIMLRHADWPYAGKPVYVATHRQLAGAPSGVQAVQGQPRQIQARLVADGHAGTVWLFGGGQLAGQYLAAGLIDRLEVGIIPVVLGRGLRLFAPPASSWFDLTYAHAFSNGLVHARYERARGPLG